MWAACSPGGRSLRFSPILTPEPPSASVIVAVPTLLPFASFSSTVTGVAAYAIAATVSAFSGEKGQRGRLRRHSLVHPLFEEREAFLGPGLVAGQAAVGEAS